VQLLVEIYRFEGAVLGEGDSEGLERLVHKDLHPMLEPPDSGDDLPARSEAVVHGHRLLSYRPAVT
jgi:hypothetical protein